MENVLGCPPMTGQAGSATKVGKNTIKADMVLPGQIAINLTTRTLFNPNSGLSLSLADITEASVVYAGQAGFIDNYVLVIKTKRYDMPKVKWRVSTLEKEADQVALIVRDVLAGEFSPADCANLPENIKALTQRFAGSCH